MDSQQQLGSWKTPASQDVHPQPVPIIGSKAPSSTQVAIPNPNGKPTIITFLRHCGSPFAEKAFRRFRYLANRHPEANFVAVSHSDQKSTDDWIIHIGGEWDVQVVVDPDRQLYAQWGLGISNTWHVFNPWSVYSAYKLGKQEGIWGTQTQSGDKWQMAGTFAVDEEGLVRWVSIAKSADDIPDFKEALRSVAEKR